MSKRPGENPVWRWFIYLKFEDTKTLGLKVNIKTVSGLDKSDSSVIQGQISDMHQCDAMFVY